MRAMVPSVSRRMPSEDGQAQSAWDKHRIYKVDADASGKKIHIVKGRKLIVR